MNTNKQPNINKMWPKKVKILFYTLADLQKSKLSAFPNTKQLRRKTGAKIGYAEFS